jgi:hypothetical protein
MKRVLLLTIAITLLLAVSPVFGQNTTIQYTGGYTGSWNGEATGFYSGTIGGVTANPGMICDDFADTIGNGQTWTAEGVRASTLTPTYINSQSRFGSVIGVSGYAEMAYLVNAMFTTSPSPAQQVYYSEAIWYIGANGTGWVLGSNTLDVQAQTLVNNAIAYAASTSNSFAAYTNLWLYTAIPVGQTAQEMWGNVPVPEGGATLMYLLLAGVTCFGAMFYSRRRITMGDLA